MDLQIVKRFIGLLSLAGLALILVVYFDFQDYSWASNGSNYIAILASGCTAFAAFASYFEVKKKTQP